MHVFMCECTVCYIRLVLYLQFNKTAKHVQILLAVHIYEQHRKGAFHLEDVIHHWPAMSHMQTLCSKKTNFNLFLYIHFIGHNFISFIDNPTNNSSKSNSPWSKIPSIIHLVSYILF